MFEHASDCRILLKHLLKTTDEPATPTEAAGPKNSSIIQAQTLPAKVYYVKLQTSSEGESLSRVSSQSTIGETEDEQSEKDANTLLALEKQLLDLTLVANGKADLYFHAYFWTSFGLHLYMRANN